MTCTLGTSPYTRKHLIIHTRSTSPRTRKHLIIRTRSMDILAGKDWIMTIISTNTTTILTMAVIFKTSEIFYLSAV